MSVFKAYKVRSGKPLPVLGTGTTGQSMVMYTFGSECNKIISCENDTNVVLSSQMCLFNPDEGAFISASYRAYPEKVNGKLVFNSVLVEKPTLSDGLENEECAGLSDSLFSNR